MGKDGDESETEEYYRDERKYVVEKEKFYFGRIVADVGPVIVLAVDCCRRMVPCESQIFVQEYSFHCYQVRK